MEEKKENKNNDDHDNVDVVNDQETNDNNYNFGFIFNYHHHDKRKKYISGVHYGYLIGTEQECNAEMHTTLIMDCYVIKQFFFSCLRNYGRSIKIICT